MRHAIEKATGAGNHRVIVTERGFSFGYNNLVVDMRAFPILRRFGFPVVYDVTHSLQLPGAGDGVTAGQAEFIEPMASAGVAAGVDGVFMEVHDRPEQAKATRKTRCGSICVEPGAQPRVGDDRQRVAARDRRNREPGMKPGVRNGTSSAIDLARKVLRIEADAIASLIDRVGGDFERALDLLFECGGRVIVTGMGKSGIICRKIAATLSSTGTSAWFLHPAEAIHGDLGAIREDDVVLALSQSGETEELLRLLESIRRIGARLIAVTGYPRSTLGRAADVTLDSGIAEKPAR
jgi:D-arabinose 5-phosphate isomerase GutQ